MKGTKARYPRYSRLAMLGGLLLATTLLSVFVRAEDVYRTPGKVLASGKNSTPVGDLKLKTYRIEEVVLSRPADVKINDRNVQADRAYKVTITGESFPVRDLPATIWIGDQRVGVAQESEDLTEVTAVTYDRSLLQEGAAISFSFGEKESYTQLPEKLNLGGNR